MRNTEERVAAVNRRVQEIIRQRQRRTIFLAAGTVLAFAAIAALIPVRAKEEL